MTVVLMVMSGKEPHTIIVTWIGMVGMLAVGQSCLLGRAAIVDSVVCVGGHKMHIFTVNIPTFHGRYRR
jgi:hypothetical protein